MLTDFNDFWHTASGRNFSLVDCKFAHLTWENVTQYLKVHCFPRRKWVALKRTGCVVWQNKWKQSTECSEWPPCAWTHAPTRFRHWSMAETTEMAVNPRRSAAVQPTSQQAAAKNWLFWHSPGTVATVWVRWINLQPFNVKFLQDSVCQND